jgi:hypothetical protein
MQNVISYPGRAEMAKGLGDVYAKVATNISKAVALNPPPAELQPYATPDGIVKETGTAVRQKLGNDVDLWRVFFGLNETSGLRGYLNALGEQGKLNTAADYITIYQDVATGLRAVR